MVDGKANKSRLFGLRLRELREQAGLTQVQLAEKSGLHSQAVVKLERGEREPAWSTLLALAEALAVSVAAFTETPTSEQSKKPGKSSGEAATTKPTNPRKSK